MLANYPDFHLTRGKKVLEIRPSIEWNKGDALKYLLETLGFRDSGDVFPIYIGDDRTDEDAFKVHITFFFFFHFYHMLFNLNGSIWVIFNTRLKDDTHTHMLYTNIHV